LIGACCTLIKSGWTARWRNRCTRTYHRCNDPRRCVQRGAAFRRASPLSTTTGTSTCRRFRVWALEEARPGSEASSLRLVHLGPRPPLSCVGRGNPKRRWHHLRGIMAALKLTVNEGIDTENLQDPEGSFDFLGFTRFGTKLLPRTRPALLGQAAIKKASKRHGPEKVHELTVEHIRGQKNPQSCGKLKTARRSRMRPNL